MSVRQTRRAASYQDAINWIALNDDTTAHEADASAPVSVTMALVADLWGREDSEVIADTLSAVRLFSNMRRRQQANTVAVPVVEQPATEPASEVPNPPTEPSNVQPITGRNKRNAA